MVDEEARLRRTALVLLLSLVAAAAFFSSCRGDAGPSVRTDPDGRVHVTFWHSMTAPLDGGLKRIVDEFNAAQDEYRVEMLYQGGYEESLTKLINSIRSGSLPALIQLNDTSTQIMADSEEVTAVQDFIDEEAYDLSDFEPRALDYYRLDGRLFSLPFNLAGPILYYDKLAFADAGLDPERPPRTLDEVREYSQALYRENDQGEVTRSGIALRISPWIFEQMLAKQGAVYANHGNGRDGRATEVVFDEEGGRRIVEWWDEMVDSGLGYNAGTRGETAPLALAQGRAAMMMESTAALAGLAFFGISSDRVGTGFLPAPEGEGGGIVMGGASVWIMNRRPDLEQRGAWEFVKFASTPEQQAQWHAQTGYFPSRVSAYDLPAATERRTAFPQFTTAVDQLRASPSNRATDGVLLGKLPEVRGLVVEAFELIVSTDGDPGAALEDAAGTANDIIRTYNLTVPGG